MKPLSEQDIERIVRLAEDGLSEQQAREAEALLQSDTDLSQEYRQQKRIAEHLKDLLKAEPLPVPTSQEDYWKGIQKKIHAQTAGREEKKVSFWRKFARVRKVWATAAAACLVVSWVSLSQMGVPQQSQPMGYSEVETGAGISTTTLESETICIELITSISIDPIGT